MDDVVEVGTFTNEGEAEIVIGLLEAAGIEAYMSHEVGGPFRSGPISITVSPEDADAAKALMEAGPDSYAGEPDEAQPGEGEE